MQKILACLGALATGALSTGLPAAAASATVRHSFIIPPTDGYGIDECLSTGAACGRAAADSYCAAHGLSAALTFGRADDLTASIPEADPDASAVQPGSLVVNCAE